MLQQLWQLALLGLQIRVSSNVLLLDENIGNRALAGYALKGVLDGSTIIYIKDTENQFPFHNLKGLLVEGGSKHTNLVQLNGVEPCPQVGQKLFCSFAVWAVGFAEDG